MKLLSNKKPTTKLSFPRVGGVNSIGVWSGTGHDDQGLKPRSLTCMRQFRADPIKNYQAMYPIEEKCKKGLKDQTEILFSNPDEPHTHQGLSVLRNLEVDLNSKGMEPVFHIRTGPNPGDVINMLKTPGVVTKQMIQQWIIDLTQLGVYRTDGTRHPVCPFDVQNLQLSAEAVLNSCTPQLHQDLEDQLLPGERDGPMILHRTI